MSWHTHDGGKTCLLNSMNGIYRRMDNAITERAKAVGISENGYLMQKTLDPFKTHSSYCRFTGLTSYFIDPEIAEPIIQSGAKYCLKLQTLYQSGTEEYAKKRGFLQYTDEEPYGELLLPKPSAKVLDSWYRYINDLVYIQRQAKEMPYGSRQWTAVWREYSEAYRTFAVNADGFTYMSHMHSDKQDCYIEVKKDDYLGDFGISLGILAVVQHDGSTTPEAYDAFKEQVVAAAEAAIRSVYGNYIQSYRDTPHHRDAKMERVNADLHDTITDVRYSHGYSEFLGIYNIPAGWSWRDGFPADAIPLSDIYGMTCTMDVQGRQYVMDYTSEMPEIITQDGIPLDYRIRFNGYVSQSGTEPWLCPEKLDLQYYDPPNEEELK